MVYDYESGYERIKDILDNELTVLEKGKLPDESSFTFDNGYYSWVTGVFIDIRESSNLFSSDDKEKVSKIIRSFTSEIIEILRDNDLLREIGIRGDCVYAIYTTPKKKDIMGIVNYTFYVNTYMKLLNKLLVRKNYPEVEVGIGVGTAKELVVKAGRKGVGINNLVWIGDAVTRASNLSSLGKKDGNKAIIVSSLTYENIEEEFEEKNGKEGLSWFTRKVSTKYGVYYDANIIKTDFDKWIDTV